MADPNPIVVTPPNTMPRIGSIWAFLSKDADGNEGVCAGQFFPGGPFMPLIAADPARLESIKPLAVELARLSGMTIVVVEFTERRELGVIP